MAESAVKSAANVLGKLIVQEGKYLWGVEDKVKELRNELIWMQGFLRDADSLQYDDEIIALWVLQIKEYVCEAEDVVDKFVIQVASRRRRSNWVDNVRRWSCIATELFALHQTASKIDSLKLRISALTPKLQTYGLKTAYGMKTYRTHEALSEQAHQRISYAHLESKTIVGLDIDTDIIVDALLSSKTENRMVVGIYGMGGLGKTTLATKVYNHDKIVKHFTGGCAWAYISKQFQVQNVLQKLVADLTSKSADMMAGKTNEALIRELREFIRKNRCLVVLDDVWETIVWDSLEAVFPPIGVESGSKVLLTTRKKDVARHADGKSLPKPDPLKMDESWELLQLTLGWGDGGSWGKKNEDPIEIEICASSGGENFQTNASGTSREEDPEIELNECNGNKKAHTEIASSSKIFGNDGQEVINLGKEIVKHCNGIPLAIVVLGGILRKKESVNEWRLVRENITSYLRRGNDHGRSYMEVLVLSYNDLPYHLKPCFLHLGNFPEDFEIRTEKLYRMWVAEGLVSWPHDRVSSTESLEDIANSYLSELAQVGMVQITSKGSDGRIKSVRVHDLMRDVCLQKAATENYLSTIDHRPCPNEPQILSSSLLHTRLLHMAIYLAEGVTNYLPEFLTSKAHEYLRSLLFFGGQAVQGAECEAWMTRVCNDFPWLWVLDIEGLRLQGKLSGDVQKMIRLRYLNLKGTDVSELPSSIGNMRFLQTLDLRVSFAGPIKIPNTLWKLEQLRHLFLPKKPYEIKKSEFCRLDTLICLETLKNLVVGKFRVEDIQRLRKLKKFSIKGFVSEGEILKNIVESPASKSGNLRTCSIGVGGTILDKKPCILSNFNCLHRLDVSGKISFLEDNVLPQSLQVLNLEYCALENDPMRILGSLHHLKGLSLGHNSFVGKEMICEAESFPQLTILNLQWLANLEDWTVKKNSMSGLKKVIIMDCGKLKMIPSGLPSSVRISCSPCINGIEKYGTCSYFGATIHVDDLDILIERADDTRSLVNLLVNDHSKRVVLMGPSGVGKATLARMLDHQPEIKGNFDAIAWAHCPYRDIPRHLLQRLLRQLDPAEGVNQYSSENSHSAVKLKEVIQQKKCLVVLIDFAASLEDIDATFRADDNPKGSKILITTVPHKPDMHFQRRLSKIKSLDKKRKPVGSVSDCYIDLKPLSEEERLNLFTRRLGGALSGNEGDEKLKLGKSMLQHSNGHPLSIIMLGGLLKMKKSLIEWQNIQKEVNLRQDKAQGPQLIHALSYDDLPTHLKPCFHYLASFPVGTEISTSKLYSMWIAAGLVILKDNQDSSKRRKDSELDQAVKLLENVAVSNLEELVVRGMVQVVKRGPNRRICTCRLHSSLQNLCLEKARNERFVNVVVGEVESSASALDGIAKHDEIERRPTKCFALQRRLFLGKAERKENVTTNADHLEPSNDMIDTEYLSVHLNQHVKEVVPSSAYARYPQLKSLCFFPKVSDTSIKEHEWEWFTAICNQFRLLRVLDLEGMWMTDGSLPVDVGNLRQLRFLSLRETWVNDLPPSIQLLTNLQMLDLRVRGSVIVPDVLYHLQNLRYLYLPDSCSFKQTKLRLHGLNNLQTLANLHTDKVDLDCVAELKNLRKILIKNIHPENELDDKLKSISARIDLSINSEVLNGNSSILSTFHNLNNMTIKGRISISSLPDRMFPKMLKELKLKHTELVDDPIPILRQLPGLTHLFFDHDAFLGKKMTFSVGFPRLAHLTLRLLSILEELDMTDADHLRHIEPVIIDCWRYEVKTPTGAEIEVGPLCSHPLMELLDLQLQQQQQPSLDNDENVTMDRAAETMDEV